MPRPRKCRRVDFLPDATYFKPAGIPLQLLKEVRLSLEEAEAIRLKDLEGLEQGQCAERMNVSRPTFQRILAAARQKVAEALLQGKAIRIKGGDFEMARHRFRCLNGHEWDLPSGVTAGVTPELCPTCNTASITPVTSIGAGWGGNAGVPYGAGRGRRWHSVQGGQR